VTIHPDALVKRANLTRVILVVVTTLLWFAVATSIVITAFLASQGVLTSLRALAVAGLSAAVTGTYLMARDIVRWVRK
jgi:hypothetical protein